MNYGFSRYIKKFRDMIDKTCFTLHHLCESVLRLISTTTVDTMELISTDFQFKDIIILLDGLKQLFCVSEKEQQLQLLTIVPSDWGRKKIEYFFGCTEHQSKRAIWLTDTFGVLARPAFFSGDKEVEKSIIDEVLRFYEKDDISRQSSNKKDSINVHGDEKMF